MIILLECYDYKTSDTKETLEISKENIMLDKILKFNILYFLRIVSLALLMKAHKCLTV